MNKVDYRSIDKDTAQYCELTAKQKIEWILFRHMSFEDYQKNDFAKNVMHACYRYYEAGHCTYEEALEAMVINFHGQVNDLMDKEIERMSLSPQSHIIIDKGSFHAKS